MRQVCPLLLAVAVAMECLGTPAVGADWPMWRYDGCRSASSPEQLPAELHLQWVRDLPAAMSAWPNESRLHFDICYEPVVAGKSLLLGSPNDGSVTAFQSETGEQQWRFLSDGPVRFSPAVWKEKVYFGSDDGFCYCLALKDGAMLWKVRVAPDDRHERRHLGNNRLISCWPVRGGPVVADDTVYTAAGIWPMLGVFIVALDAQTGRTRWRNDEMSYLEKVRIDHNEVSASGLSPQGYMLVVGDKLLVPNGRSMPAVLDRHKGRLLNYVQGYRNGDCRVTASGNLAYVGRDGVVDLRTGREVGSRWAAAGKQAPKGFDPSKFEFFEGPFHPYKFIPGCNGYSALAGPIVYDLDRGGFSARDSEHVQISEYQANSFGSSPKPMPWRWDPPLLWKLPIEPSAKTSGGTAIIRAGKRLYGHTGKTLAAAELPADGHGQPVVAWKLSWEGTAGELLAADGKLFVVTREGRIACFGSAAAQARTHRRTTEPLKGSDGAKPHAADILAKAGVTDGYCLLLGLNQEGLAEELLLQSQVKLIAVDCDRQRVDRLRERLTAAGVYGTRAEVFCSPPRKFALPPYLANLLVTEYPSEGGDMADRLMRQWFEVLRPYGGTAYLELPKGVAARMLPAGFSLPRAEFAQAGRAVLVRRSGSLPDSAPWTHEYADAATSYFSRDRCVRPPLTVLWYGDGPGYGFWTWHDYNTGIKPQVVGGRLFAVRGHELFAYDIYTGRLLWTVKTDRARFYASLEDGVYMAGSNGCVVYDSTTGRPIRTYRFDVESGRPANATAIRVGADVIVIATMTKKPGEWSSVWDGTDLIVMERASGRILWKRKAPDGFHFHALAIGDGTVFCCESPSHKKAKKTDMAAAAGDDLPAPTTVLALDALSGKTRWAAATSNQGWRDTDAGTVGIRRSDDWLGYSRDLQVLLAGKTLDTYAYDARDGRPLWHERIGHPPIILCGDRFLTQQCQPFDLRTGKSLGPARISHLSGCNYAVANPYLMLMRDTTASYLDLASGESRHLYCIRSGCSNSLIAADGLLNAPCFSVGCVCNYPIQTSFAMVPTAAWQSPDHGPCEEGHY